MRERNSGTLTDVKTTSTVAVSARRPQTTPPCNFSFCCIYERRHHARWMYIQLGPTTLLSS